MCFTHSTFFCPGSRNLLLTLVIEIPYLATYEYERETMNALIPRHEHNHNHNIKSGDITSSQIPELQKKLESFLPYSIPLVERIKFHLRHPISETSRIFVAASEIPQDDTLATGPSRPTNNMQQNQNVNVSDTWLRQDTTTSAATPWLAAHIDLAHYGQTQVWLFASWEHPSHSSHTRTHTHTHTHTHTEEKKNNDIDIDPLHEALVNSLFKYIYTTLIPTMPTTPSEEWLTLRRTGKTLTTPYARTKILFGTVGDKLWRYFPDHARARTDPGYLKYIFTPDNNPATAARDASFRLPQDYTFTPLRPTDLQTVLDRSSIPRTLSTLSEYLNVGVVYQSNPDPVAWGFLGKDASISSLHTETEHRGLGIALCVTRELIRRQHRQASEHGDDKTETGLRWAHADVSQSNMPSRRVMEKLGGKPMWMVMWTELDLEKICQPSTS
ncbi:hypothetical protein RBB50_012075 [Rhinocladiella similis]